jgi:hypothetical protein
MKRSKQQLNKDMNKYQATVRVKGQWAKTAIFADCAVHARLLLQWQYGFANVLSTPTPIHETATIKPLSPQQARIDTLKRQKDSVAKQLKAERDRQRIAKAQQQISNINSTN